ncbi:MAG: ABC transporter permease [Gemmatimonadales bacterium]
MRLDARLASRYLRSRRSSRLISLISLIAIGGVTVGVMALIVVMGVMNGLTTELRNKIFVASPHISILTYGLGLRVDNWRYALGVVSEHPEVVSVQPFVLSQGLINAGYDYNEGLYVLGIEPDTGTAAATPIAERFLSGDLSFSTTRSDVDGAIVLGSRIARRMSAYPGDRVRLVSPGGSTYSASLGAFYPKIWFFEVTGIFETGMYEYDNAYSVMSRTLAQEFAALDTAVTGLQVRLRDPWIAPEVGAELAESLGPRYRAEDWQRQNSQLFAALQLEKLAMGVVLLLIVVVAAFNIVSTLTMLVTEKTREIGILRAMGLSAAAVRRMFVFQGAVIGLVGTALGASLGLIVGRLVDQRHLISLDPSVYFIDHLPVRFHPVDVAIVILASVAVATLATFYPARQAGMLNPVDAIRYE